MTCQEANTDKTGEIKGRWKSVDGETFDTQANCFNGEISRLFEESQSDQSLRNDFYRMTAEQRQVQSEINKMLEMFRAFCASLPDEERCSYSQFPPILVVGGNYAKERIKEFSKHFTVVVIDEYMTSQTCHSCLNEEVVKGKHRMRVCKKGICLMLKMVMYQES